MPGFIVTRLVFGLFTLIAVSVVIFVATQLLPSDPAKAVLGRDASPASVAALRNELGLDQSAVRQYLAWLGNLLTGDFGRSFSTHLPVTEMLGSRIENSLFLMILAAAITVPTAIALGACQAIYRDRPFDSSSSYVLLGLASVPEFVVGILLVTVFATSILQISPAVASFGDDPVWAHVDQLVLPVLTLTLSTVPYISRVVRASVIEIMESDYVEMARLKGVPEAVVLRRHALPNALGPALQVIALNIAYFAGGVIVVEYLFNYPGIGGAFQAAVRARDIPVIQFLAVVLAGSYVVINLVADVATVLLTPKMRTQL